MRRTIVTFMLIASVALGLPSSIVDVGVASAAEAGYGAYTMTTQVALESPEARAQVAANNRLVVIKGTVKLEHVADLRSRRPGITILAYEQAAALSTEEVAELQGTHPEWLARDSGGNLITPVRVSENMTLGDLTNRVFRSWQVAKISSEVTGSGVDGTFIDTLGVYFPDTFYSARPWVAGAPVTNTAWRDASASLVRATKKETGKTVIVNGFGLGTGAAYNAYRADADVIINEASGVQIEGFTRWGGTPTTTYLREPRWLADLDYLSTLGAKGKIALALTEVDDPNVTVAKVTELRDYALGSFLAANTPALSYFNFASGPNVLPSMLADPRWAATLGPPLGPRATVGTDIVRDFEGGRLVMHLATPPTIIIRRFGELSTTRLSGPLTN